jgi:hypothetical protein
VGPVQDYEKNLVAKRSKGALKAVVNDALDANGQLKKNVRFTDFIESDKEPVPVRNEPETLEQMIEQRVLLSDAQRSAWGPQQMMKHPKRQHKAAIVETETDGEGSF